MIIVLDLYYVLTKISIFIYHKFSKSRPNINRISGILLMLIAHRLAATESCQKYAFLRFFDYLSDL